MRGNFAKFAINLAVQRGNGQEKAMLRRRQKTTAFEKRRKRKRNRRIRLISLLGMASVVILITTALWRGRHARVVKPPSQVVPPASLYPDPPGIILHSSNSPAVVHGVQINARSLERIHADDHPTWATVFEGKTYHIGYHYVILPDGAIEQGRPDHCPGCHAPHYNNYIGICVVGCFDPSVHHSWQPSRPTPKEVSSVVSLCERLMSQYHIPPERVLRHRDTKQTWCPGRRFPYDKIMRQLKDYAAQHPETRPIAVNPAPTVLAHVRTAAVAR